MATQKEIQAKILRNKVREYRDIDLNFIANPLTGDVSVLTNFEAVKNSLKNIILTERLEKWFLPKFGSKVSSSLFDQLDIITINTLTDSIRTSILALEPRVNLLSVDLNLPESEPNTVDVSIKFSLKNDPSRVAEFTFVLERVR